jgi:hypothetical protein
MEYTKQQFWWCHTSRLTDRHIQTPLHRFDLPGIIFHSPIWCSWWAYYNVRIGRLHVGWRPRLCLAPWVLQKVSKECDVKAVPRSVIIRSATPKISNSCVRALRICCVLVLLTGSVIQNFVKLSTITSTWVFCRREISHILGQSNKKSDNERVLLLILSVGL